MNKLGWGLAPRDPQLGCWEVWELREMVRHRAKLVALRSHCRAQVHAVLAECGVAVPMSDLFGVAGIDLLNDLDVLDLPARYMARIASFRRLIDLDLEIDIFTRLTHGQLARDPGYGRSTSVPRQDCCWSRSSCRRLGRRRLCICASGSR